MRGPTEAQTRQWNQAGYLVFSDAIEGAELRRLQTAFDYWAEQCKADWLDRIERGEQAATFYDIPDALEKDEIFVDIVDHPSYYGCLRQFTDAEPMFLAEQVRTVPRGRSAIPAGTPTSPTATRCTSRSRST